MPERLVITPGRRFGRLVVVREGKGQEIKGKTHRRRTLVVRCDCGSPDKEVPLYCLTSGSTKSCGCYRSEVAPVSRLRERNGKPPLITAREQELRRKGVLWLAARVVELEVQLRRATSELGAMRSELERDRMLYR